MTLSFGGAVRLMHVISAALSIPLAKRSRDHQAIAVFLVVTAVADLARYLLEARIIFPAWEQQRAAGLDPARATLAGWVRAAAHVDQALFVFWPASVAALSMAVLLHKRPWIVLPAWATFVVLVSAGYPIVRGVPLLRVYLAAELLGACGATACFAAWTMRREAMTLPRFMVICIATFQAATLVGPYLGDPATSWDNVRALYLVMYTALALVHVTAIIVLRRADER